MTARTDVIRLSDACIQRQRTMAIRDRLAVLARCGIFLSAEHKGTRLVWFNPRAPFSHDHDQDNASTDAIPGRECFLHDSPPSAVVLILIHHSHIETSVPELRRLIGEVHLRSISQCSDP
jgi:hypothetical protein